MFRFDAGLPLPHTDDYEERPPVWDDENGPPWSSEFYATHDGIKPISRTMYGASVDETIVDGMSASSHQQAPRRNTIWNPHLYATKGGISHINPTVYGVVDDISTRANALSGQGQQQASGLQTYATPVERLQAWDPASYEMFQLRKDGENETTWNSELYPTDDGIKPNLDSDRDSTSPKKNMITRNPKRVIAVGVALLAVGAIAAAIAETAGGGSSHPAQNQQNNTGNGTSPQEQFCDAVFSLLPAPDQVTGFVAVTNTALQTIWNDTKSLSLVVSMGLSNMLPSWSAMYDLVNTTCGLTHKHDVTVPAGFEGFVYNAPASSSSSITPAPDVDTTTDVFHDASSEMPSTTNTPATTTDTEEMFYDTSSTMPTKATSTVPVTTTNAPQMSSAALSSSALTSAPASSSSSSSFFGSSSSTPVSSAAATSSAPVSSSSFSSSSSTVASTTSTIAALTCCEALDVVINGGACPPVLNSCGLFGGNFDCSCIYVANGVCTTEWQAFPGGIGYASAVYSYYC